MNDDALQNALDRLCRIIRECGSAVVAYSGGVDSALVAAVAARELSERALACIGGSPSYSARERQAAVDLAGKIGIRCRLIATDEQLDPDYVANAADRCYHCKAALYGKLRTVADEEAMTVILDGSNADDIGDHRPGISAGHELGVRSPLMEAGIGKDQVRALARRLGLDAWDKPSMACLASRIPHGTPVRPELLRRIEQAEEILAGMGFRQFRVRHHGEVARIELPEDDLETALSMRDALAQPIRRLGWRFVTLDLAGFHSGSLSDATSPQEDLTT